jgi:hypothetical protein
MTAISRRDDLKVLFVISFFVSALVRAFFPVGALTLSVVRLIKPAQDGPIAILVASASARFVGIQQVLSNDFLYPLSSFHPPQLGVVKAVA